MRMLTVHNPSVTVCDMAKPGGWLPDSMLLKFSATLLTTIDECVSAHATAHQLSDLIWSHCYSIAMSTKVSTSIVKAAPFRNLQLTA